MLKMFLKTASFFEQDSIDRLCTAFLQTKTVTVIKVRRLNYKAKTIQHCFSGNDLVRKT